MRSREKVTVFLKICIIFLFLPLLLSGCDFLPLYSQFTGKKVQAAFTVQPDLLGGLRAQIEDTLIDGTIKRRFEKLQEELVQ